MGIHCKFKDIKHILSIQHRIDYISSLTNQNLQVQLKVMGYKASLDIVLCLRAVRTKFLKKVGSIRYRVSLYYLNEKEKILCRPYNILRNKKQSSHSPTDSELDQDSIYYYSKMHQTSYSDISYIEQQSCFFRAYVNAQNLPNQQLNCKIQLMISSDNEESFKVLGTFQSIIRKSHNLSSYLPICFDEFQGFVIQATYHSALMEFKFETENQDFPDFFSYVNAATHGFNRHECQNFYQYYRTLLDEELFSIQNRHSDLLRVNNFNQHYPFVKLSNNTRMQTLLRNMKQISIPRSIKIQFVEQIINQFLNLKAYIYQKWNQFIEFVTFNSEVITMYYQQIYNLALKQRMKINVFSHKIYNHDWTYCKYQDSGKNNIQHALNDKMKIKDQELWADDFPIQHTRFFGQQCKSIKIFEEKYLVNVQECTTRGERKNSLINHYKTQQNKKFFSLRGSQLKQRQQEGRLVSQPFLKHHFHSHSLQQIQHNHLYHPPGYDKHYGKMDENYQNKLVSINNIQTPVSSSKFISRLQPFKKSFQKLHVVVLVHGFQASRQDFFLIKNCLQIQYGVEVFISTSNEGRTQDSIQVLGKRMAMQLANFLGTKENFRLSFMGHSLGGLIIRSALTYLENVEDKLYTYISLSSPHLGYLYTPSTLIQAGLWFINVIQKVDSLQQLRFNDASNIRDCYLYRLAKSGTLSNFEKIALVGSSQDQYTPYQSTRIQKNPTLLNQYFSNSQKVRAVHQMVDGILLRVKCQQISRMNVVFDIEQKGFDSWIGRTAHIKYLCDPDFIKKFIIAFQQFFILPGGNLKDKVTEIRK